MLLVVTFSPNPVAESFLFSGGRMFLIEVWESRANEFSSDNFIWLLVGDRGLYLGAFEKFGIKWSSSMISKSDFLSDFSSFQLIDVLAMSILLLLVMSYFLSLIFEVTFRLVDGSSKKESIVSFPFFGNDVDWFFVKLVSFFFGLISLFSKSSNSSKSAFLVVCLV